MLIHGCKKTNATGSSGSGVSTSGTIVTSLPASVTSVGKPVGSPVTKTIGPAGGSLVSANGVVEIKIPPGALSANTAISIQPVMNEMPGSLDTLAYDLLPNGTKFNSPATITFHYTSDQVPDNRAEFLFVAYQDSSGAWAADAKQRDYDTTAKTVSLDISHFTIWNFGEQFTLGEKFIIHGKPLTLRSFETSIITVNETYAENDHGEAKIIQDNIVDGKYLTDWSVNAIPYGNTAFGTISPNGSQATYLSPIQILDATTVYVTVHINIKLAIWKKGKEVQQIDGFTKKIAIRLEPYHTYMLTVVLKYVDSAVDSYDPANNLLPVYTDIVVLHLKVQAKLSQPIATLIETSNSEPSVTPSSYNYQFTKWEWLPDPYGVINVSDVKTDEAYAGLFSADSILQFDVTHTNAYLPGFKVTNLTGGGVAQFEQARAFSGIPQDFKIEFKANDHSNADNFSYTYSEGALGKWFYVTAWGQ